LPASRLKRRVSTGETKPQVPPLRFASVGMTILLCPQQLHRGILDPCIRIVIPTEAKRSGGTCGFVSSQTTAEFQKAAGLAWIFSPWGVVAALAHFDLYRSNERRS